MCAGLWPPRHKTQLPPCFAPAHAHVCLHLLLLLSSYSYKCSYLLFVFSCSTRGHWHVHRESLARSLHSIPTSFHLQYTRTTHNLQPEVLAEQLLLCEYTRTFRTVLPTADCLLGNRQSARVTMPTPLHSLRLCSPHTPHLLRFNSRSLSIPLGFVFVEAVRDFMRRTNQ